MNDEGIVLKDLFDNIKDRIKFEDRVGLFYHDGDVKFIGVYDVLTNNTVVSIMINAGAIEIDWTHTMTGEKIAYIQDPENNYYDITVFKIKEWWDSYKNQTGFFAFNGIS